MGNNNLGDFDNRYLIPDDKQTSEIKEHEENVLMTMLEKILAPQSDSVSAYSEVIEQLPHTDQSMLKRIICDFLKKKLTIENFKSIFDFAKQNKLGGLKGSCEAYYKKNKIEIAFAQKNS